MRQSAIAVGVDREAGTFLDKVTEDLIGESQSRRDIVGLLLSYRISAMKLDSILHNGDESLRLPLMQHPGIIETTQPRAAMQWISYTSSCS